MLFSATQTQKIAMITTLVLKKEPIYVGVDDDKEMATVDGLQQGYVTCPSEKRFLLLFTFLKKNKQKKIMVFFSSCMSVKYHHELLNYIDLPVMSIHVSYQIFSHTIFVITRFSPDLIFMFMIDRVNRSRRKEPRLFINFATLPLGFYFALMWLQEV